MKTHASRFCRVLFAIYIFCILISSTSISAGDANSGNAFFAREQYEKALSIYQNVLDSDLDEDGRIHFRIGLCFLMNGFLEEAGQYFELAQERNPRIFKGCTFSIPTGGMRSTLLPGDFIIVDVEFYEFAPIERFDVVALMQPQKENKRFVKRIVGLPGEKVEIKDNIVYINDRQLSGETFGVYLSMPPEIARSMANFESILLSDQEYFVLGDNRHNTFDSRKFGPVKKQEILGKALVVYGSQDSSEDPPRQRPERVGLVIR